MHRAFVLLLLCLATAVGGEAPSFRVVTIKGADDRGCHNLSRSCLVSTMAREGRPARMVVREGDLLLLEMEALVAWRQVDGDELALAHEADRLLLGGNVVALTLPRNKEERTAVWQWIEKADRSALAKLRCLRIQAMDADRLPLLRKIADANPDLGIWIEYDVKEPILSILRPTWCGAGAAMLADRDRVPDASLRNIRYADIMYAKKVEHWDIVARMPALRHLMISRPAGELPERLPDSWRRLRALTLAHCSPNLASIAPLAPLADLEELYILENGNLTDISALTGLRKLRALSLWACGELTDLTALASLRELRWLELPPKTTQDQFAKIVADHPKLEQLALTACKGVRDLRPLAKLPALRALVLVESDAPLDPLAQVAGLRFLALGWEYFDEAPAAVQRVEKALPKAVIVEGGTFGVGMK